MTDNDIPNILIPELSEEQTEHVILMKIKSDKGRASREHCG